jgi:hypothetical protein
MMLLLVASSDNVCVMELRLAGSSDCVLCANEPLRWLPATQPKEARLFNISIISRKLLLSIIAAQCTPCPRACNFLCNIVEGSILPTLFVDDVGHIVYRLNLGASDPEIIEIMWEEELTRSLAKANEIFFEFF